MKGTGIFGWIQLPKWFVFCASAFLTIACLALFFPRLSGICSEYQPNCVVPYSTLSLYLFWAPILLFFSVLTLPINRTVFNSWIKFMVPWTLFSILVISATPGNFGNNLEINLKAVASLSLTAISFFASLLIIIIKSVQVYWRKK